MKWFADFNVKILSAYGKMYLCDNDFGKLMYHTQE